MTDCRYCGGSHSGQGCPGRALAEIGNGLIRLAVTASDVIVETLGKIGAALVEGERATLEARALGGPKELVLFKAAGNRAGRRAHRSAVRKRRAPEMHPSERNEHWRR